MSAMECSSVCDTGTGWPGPEFLYVSVRKTRFGGLREELWDALGMDYVAGETD